MRVVLLLIVLLIIHVHALAKPAIHVQNPWIREVPPVSKMSALFMKIVNKGDTEDVLLSVKTDASKFAEIHMMAMEGQMMKMRKLDFLKLPPKAIVELRPGGIHIMLIELTKPLKEGQKVKVELYFKRSGKIVIQAPVRALH